MTKTERQLIFNKFGGKCAYCGCELPKNWHADHIEPIVRDSKWNRSKGRFEQTGTCRKPEKETLENYNPACASCNIQKNSFTLEQFRNNIQQFVNSLNQYSTQYKFAKRYGLVLESDVKVEFYFEKIVDEVCINCNYYTKQFMFNCNSKVIPSGRGMCLLDANSRNPSKFDTDSCSNFKTKHPSK